MSDELAGGAGGEGEGGTGEEVRGGGDQGGLAGKAGAGEGEAQAHNAWYREFANELPDDVRPDWEKSAGRYTSKAEFAKSYTEMRRNFDKRVPLPSNPAEMADFYQKHGQAFGIPKDPNEYELDLPDDVPFDETEKAQLEEYRKVAHRNGRSKDAFKEDLKFLAESRKLTDDARAARAQKMHAKNIQRLKDEWQFDFEQNVAIYQTAVNHFAREDKDEFLKLRLEDGTLAQNHPVIANMFIRAGRLNMEDDRDLNDFNRTARVGAKTEIEAIEAKLEEKYGAPRNWPKEEHAKLQALYEKLHGSRPTGPHQMYGRGR